MTALAILAEEQITEALAAGAFGNLPGRGAPLRWEDDAAVPSDWRLAFHVLRSNGFAPGWIEMGSELRRDIARTRGLLTDHDRREAARVREDELADLVRDLNQRIARYNLLAPGPRWHLPFLLHLEPVSSRLPDPPG